MSDKCSEILEERLTRDSTVNEADTLSKEDEIEDLKATLEEIKLSERVRCVDNNEKVYQVKNPFDDTKKPLAMNEKSILTVKLDHKVKMPVEGDVRSLPVGLYDQAVIRNLCSDSMRTWLVDYHGKEKVALLIYQIHGYLYFGVCVNEGSKYRSAELTLEPVKKWGNGSGKKLLCQDLCQFQERSADYMSAMYHSLPVSNLRGHLKNGEVFIKLILSEHTLDKSQLHGSTETTSRPVVLACCPISSECGEVDIVSHMRKEHSFPIGELGIGNRFTFPISFPVIVTSAHMTPSGHQKALTVVNSAVKFRYYIGETEEHQTYILVVHTNERRINLWLCSDHPGNLVLFTIGEKNFATKTLPFELLKMKPDPFCYSFPEQDLPEHINILNQAINLNVKILEQKIYKIENPNKLSKRSSAA